MSTDIAMPGVQGGNATPPAAADATAIPARAAARGFLDGLAATVALLGKWLVACAVFALLASTVLEGLPLLLPEDPALRFEVAGWLALLDEDAVFGIGLWTTLLALVTSYVLGKTRTLRVTATHIEIPLWTYRPSRVPLATIRAIAPIGRIRAFCIGLWPFVPARMRSFTASVNGWWMIDTTRTTFYFAPARPDDLAALRDRLAVVAGPRSGVARIRRWIANALNPFVVALAALVAGLVGSVLAGLLASDAGKTSLASATVTRLVLAKLGTVSPAGGHTLLRTALQDGNPDSVRLVLDWLPDKASALIELDGSLLRAAQRAESRRFAAELFDAKAAFKPQVLALLKDAGLKFVESIATVAAREPPGERLADLLTAGLDPNTIGAEGIPLLGHAAAKGHAESIPLLIGKGAKIDAADWAGRTPLVLALEQSNTGTAQALVAAGANLAHVDAGGRGIAFLALRAGLPDIAEQAFTAASVPDARTLAGQTLMHATAAGGSVAWAAKLAAGGLSPVERDGDGRTPLHHSRGRDAVLHFANLQRLRGVDVDAVDRFGRTALHEAARRLDFDTATALVEAGLRPDVADRDGRRSIELYEAARPPLKKNDNQKARARFAEQEARWQRLLMRN